MVIEIDIATHMVQTYKNKNKDKERDITIDIYRVGNKDADRY